MNFSLAKALSCNGYGSMRGNIALMLFLLALIIRLLNIATLDKFFTEDSTMYWRMAEHLFQSFSAANPVSGEWSRSAERMPLYPLFVAAIQSWISPDPLGVVILQAIIDAATAVMIAMIASALGPSISLAAGLLAALWPNMVIHSALILTDTLFLFCFTASPLAFVRFVNNPHAGAAAIIGILLGLALATRAAIQFLPPVFLIAIIVATWRAGCSSRQTIICGVLFTIAISAPIAPTLYRNYERFDRLFLTDQGSIHLIYWVLPSIQMHADGTTFDAAWKDTRKNFHKELQKKGIDKSKTAPIELRRMRQAFALKSLAEQPLTSITIAWTQGAVLNLAAPAILADQRMRSIRSDSLLGMTGGMIERTLAWYLSGPTVWRVFAGLGILGAFFATIAMIGGFIRLAITHPWMAAAGAVLILYFLLLMGPVAAPKYRLPFAPVTIVLTAIGVVELCQLLLKKVRLSSQDKIRNGTV